MKLFFLLLSLMTSWPSLANESIVYHYESATLMGADGYSRNLKLLVPVDSKAPHRKYPELYYLQGWQGAGGWEKNGVIRAEINLIPMNIVLSTLVRIGVIEPMLVINPLLNEPAVNGGDGVKHRDFFLQTLFPQIGAYVGNGQRTILGNSLGAIGAASLALHNPASLRKVILRQPLLYRDFPWNKSRDQIVASHKKRHGDMPSDDVFDVMNVVQIKMPTVRKSDEELPLQSIKNIQQPLPELFVDYGAQDKDIPLGELHDFVTSWSQKAPAQIRKQEGVGHGSQFTVIGLIDSLIFAGRQSEREPSPLGKLLLSFSDRGELAPVILRFFNGDIAGGVAQLMQSLPSGSFVASPVDVSVIKDLVRQTSGGDSLTEDLIKNLKGIKFARLADQSVRIVLQLQTSECHEFSMFRSDCVPDRVYVPVENREGWVKLKKIDTQRRLLMKQTNSNENDRKMTLLAQDLYESLRRPDEGGQRILELASEVSFRVTTEKNGTLSIKNLTGARLTSLSPSFPVDLNGLAIDKQKQVQVKVNIFGWEFAAALPVAAKK